MTKRSDSTRYSGATVSAPVFSSLGIMVLALAYLMAGCGRKPEAPATDTKTATEPASVVTAPPSPLTTPPAALTPPIPPPAAETIPSEPQPAPFRVAAFTDRGDGQPRAGLVSENTGQNRMVSTGDAFEGFNVVSIDAASGHVLMTRGDRTYRATMAPGLRLAQSEDGADEPAPTGAPDVMPGMDGPPPEIFEATADERTRGINPNDPDTWPDGYRGPAIERAAQTMPRQVFEPTENERTRGIDPNDPTTWPTGYRGPGIERAAPPTPPER